MTNPLSTDLDHILQHTEDLWADLRGERIFLTGGTGFVGCWLLESLLWANRRLNLGVRCSILTRNPAVFLSRRPHQAGDGAGTRSTGDAATFPFPAGTFSLMIHAATERYRPADAASPASNFPRDIAATERVLQLAARSRTRRFLFTSSGAVYGKQPPAMTHIPEEYAGAPCTTDATSAYAQSKRASEFLCASYARSCGFNAAIARLFAFVGPYLPLDEQYAVGNFLRDTLAGGPVRIAGDGTPHRSYLYAADLAIWLWTILMRAPSAVPFNVGSAEDITIADLARRVVEVTAPGTAIQVARRAMPGTPPQRYVPAIDRAQDELGLQVWTPLEEGLRRTWNWHRSEPASCVAPLHHETEFAHKVAVS